MSAGGSDAAGVDVRGTLISFFLRGHPTSDAVRHFLKRLQMGRQSLLPPSALDWHVLEQ
jgi:hypothetical protein